MKIKYRIKRFIENLRTKETEQDKKLQKNTEQNREVTITRESGNYYEYNAFLVYVNNYQKIVNLFGDNNVRKQVEREASEIKIIIESTFDKHFLDSLSFFHKINMQNIEKSSKVQTNFVKTSFLFSPSEDEEKVYMLISGSIGEYINLFDHFYFRYANERNRIIKSIIDIFDTQIPVVLGQFDEISERYHLNMKGINYTDISISDSNLLYEGKLSKNIGSDVILLDTDVQTNSTLEQNLDSKIRKIWNKFLQDEISKEEYHLFLYCPDKLMNASYIRYIPEYSGITKIAMFKLSYLIDHFEKEFDNTDHFLTYNKYALEKVKESVQLLLGTTIQTITYNHNSVDTEEPIEQLSMYDLVDEIIK